MRSTDNADFLPSHEIQRLQESQWLRQRDYVTVQSPFYQKLLETQPLPSALADLCELPLTDKHLLREDQARHAPFGSYLASSRKHINRLHRTSGTTGQAMNITLSAADAQMTAEIGGRSHRAAGLGPSHRVVHCLNYQMWMGGLSDHMTLEQTGAMVVPFGVGSTELLIETIEQLGINAISCTPSYPAVIAAALEKQGKSPRDLGLELALFGGEAGLDSLDFRQRIIDTWGLKPRNANYGVSDVLSNFAAQCEHSNDLHFLAADVLYPELIHPETTEPLPIAQYQEGELVLTHLRKQCQPLVRFRTADIVRITHTDTCQCGRTGFRFQVIGRSDDMIVVRGINVFPTQVSAVLCTIEELSGEYQIHLSSKEPLDRLPLHVELAADTSTTPELQNRIEDAIHQSLRVRASVTVKAPNSMPRTPGKTRRVFREHNT